MRKTIGLLVLLSMLGLAACDKDDNNNGPGRNNDVARTPNDDARDCNRARFRGGHWYGRDNRRLNCGDLNPYLDDDRYADYIYKYDGWDCDRRVDRWKNRTYRFDFGDERRCVSSEYFRVAFGYRGALYSHIPYSLHYRGYNPYRFNGYANYYVGWNGTQCFNGCDDDGISTGEAVAGTLLTVGGLLVLSGAL